MKVNLDPKVVAGVIGVVVVVAALLVFKGATTDQKAPLADPKMFVAGGDIALAGDRGAGARVPSRNATLPIASGYLSPRLVEDGRGDEVSSEVGEGRWMASE